MDTSMDILSTEYDILKSNVATVAKELESKNQLIYDCKKQIAVATALEGDYLYEIEILQSNNNTEVTELQRRVKELENAVISLRHSSNLELLRKTEVIERLRNEIKELSKEPLKNEYEESKSHQTDRDAERNSILKEEVKILSNNLVDLQRNIDNLQNKNVNMEEINNNFLMELEHAKQEFTYKTQELIETSNLIHKLQEDSFLTKLELESMKNKPLDAAKKGNSLFAEVEDSRLKTQQNIQQLKKKYSALKTDVCNKLKQMTVLGARNIELSGQLNFIKDCDEEYEKIIEAYKTNVDALESAVEEYKKEILKEQKFTGKDVSRSAMEFANNVLRTRWIDGERAIQKVNSESKKKLETFINIKNANTEMRQWKRHALQLKIENVKLDNTILELELQSNPTNIIDSDSLLDFPENKPILTIEDVIRCGSVEIRKKGNVEQKQQTKPLSLNNEIKIGMLSKSVDSETNPTKIKLQSDSISAYPEMKLNILDIKKENNGNNNIGHQHEQIKMFMNNTVEGEISHSVKVEFDHDEQSKLPISNNITRNEPLNSTSFETKIELLEPEILGENIKENIVKKGNESYVDQAGNNELLITVENISGNQLLKPTSCDISTEPNVLSTVKMEFNQDEQSKKTLILDDRPRSEILNSASFESKIIESNINENIKDDTVQNRDESNIDLAESVIIMENVSGIQLLNPAAHNISAEPNVSSIITMEFHQDEPSKMLIINNLSKNEVLNCTEPFEPQVLGSNIGKNIKDDIVETRDDISINLDESVILIENVSGTQLLKPTSLNISAEPNVLSTIKMEFDQDEQSKTLTLDNMPGSVILNSPSFEAKIELIEPKNLGSNIDENVTGDIVENRDDSNIDLDKLVIIMKNENMPGIQLLKPTSHNISVEPNVSSMITMRFGQDEPSKMLILDNISGSEILNSTSFEEKMELLKPHVFGSNVDKNIQDFTVEKRDDSNIDLDESVIVMENENISGTQLLKPISHNISAKPAKLIDISTTGLTMKPDLKFNYIQNPTEIRNTDVSDHSNNKSSDGIHKPLFLNNRFVSNLKNTVNTSSNSRNFDNINITNDQIQPPNEKYGADYIKSTEFNNYEPQKANSGSNQENDVVSDTIKKSLNNENVFHDMELKKSTCTKYYVTNAGYTPIAHQKCRSKTNSVEEMSNGISQLNINNAGYTPAAYQKLSLTSTPASDSTEPLKSGKKTLKFKTSIPILARRKLN